MLLSTVSAGGNIWYNSVGGLKYRINNEVTR